MFVSIQLLAGTSRGRLERALRRLPAIRHGLAAIVLAAALGACATPLRHEAVPVSQTDRATVLGGLQNARYFVDTQVPQLTQEAYAALARERAQLAPAAATDRLPPANFLAISGGGDNGAFGAGLLIGWTERGDLARLRAPPAPA